MRCRSNLVQNLPELNPIKRYSEAKVKFICFFVKNILLLDLAVAKNLECYVATLNNSNKLCFCQSYMIIIDTYGFKISFT